MKTINTYLVFILIFFIGKHSFAQENTMKGYKIEGDEVVFTFNKNDYKKVSHDAFGIAEDFKDFDIENVVVSGNFNNWSKDKWYMKKIDNENYELRKKLTDFSDDFSWEFKFVINNNFWAEPSKKDPNIIQATKDGTHLNVYNLKMYTGAYPDKNGNVRFRLRGYENAKNVVLSGTFNRWNESIFKMYKITNGWEIILKLDPGNYEYKFIVDGKWMEDPSNPDKVTNEFGEYNSHINVQRRVTFKLNAFPDAKNVILTGSFNNWNETKYRMTKVNNTWTFSLVMSGGKHHYKFIVDNKWITDPDNSVREYDDQGNINSVCMVK
ncbi:MAG: hypothetical protein BM549_07105 [Lacinutrix sp. MedPE-SW]|nr:MAG: hypothetical protein BM549_07105 [Lacinutrix sp. MedPE-SW]